MVPLLVVVGMIMNVDDAIVVDVIVLDSSQSRCTLLLQCLYCFCDTWSNHGLKITSCFSPILHIYMNNTLWTSYGNLSSLYSEPSFALLHNLCRLQRIVPSLLWHIVPVQVMASLVFCGVLKQFLFYKVDLLALCPIPCNPGWPMVCFFVWFLTANLPDIGRPTGSIAWWITETHKPCHQC